MRCCVCFIVCSICLLLVGGLGWLVSLGGVWLVNVCGDFGFVVSPLSVVWLVVGFPVLYVLSWFSIRVCGLCCGCDGWFGGWWVVAVGQSLRVNFGLGFPFQCGLVCVSTCVCVCGCVCGCDCFAYVCCCGCVWGHGF